MNTFDTDQNSPDYPKWLREMRVALGYSQRRFAELGGYSSIMQGRYETDRSKANSAIPSERTARAIRQVVESGRDVRANNAASAQSALSNVLPVRQRSLKALSPADIEQAISSAISALIGSQCQVVVNRLDWSSADAAEGSISLRRIDSHPTTE